MPTTPNYSWPIPADTDLVKDGAEAIRDLGNAIDTTVDGLPGAGLVHIKQVSTGGAVSSVNINDCFSASYNTYKIIFDFSHSAGNVGINMRLRVSGTDESGSVYRKQEGSFDGSGVGAIRTVNETSWTTITHALFTIANTTTSNSVEVFNPFEAVNTTMTSTNIFAPAGNIIYRPVAFGINNTTSYTGFTIFPASGTIDGTITVLGYKK